MDQLTPTIPYCKLHITEMPLKYAQLNTIGYELSEKISHNRVIRNTGNAKTEDCRRKKATFVVQSVFGLAWLAKAKGHSCHTKN